MKKGRFPEFMYRTGSIKGYKDADRIVYSPQKYYYIKVINNDGTLWHCGSGCSDDFNLAKRYDDVEIAQSIANELKLKRNCLKVEIFVTT